MSALQLFLFYCRDEGRLNGIRRKTGVNTKLARQCSSRAVHFRWRTFISLRQQQLTQFRFGAASRQAIKIRCNLRVRSCGCRQFIERGAFQRQRLGILDNCEARRCSRFKRKAPQHGFAKRMNGLDFQPAGGFERTRKQSPRLGEIIG